MLSIRRRMRALLVTALATMALAVPASSASAEVAVNNGNGGEVALEGWYQMWDLYCASVSLEASLSGNGEIDMHTVVAYSGITYHQCNMLDDEGDEGWSGQIVGPGDEGYLGNHEFEGLVYPNFEYFNVLFPSPLRFGIDDAVWSFDKSVIYEQQNIWVEGAFSLTSADPEITLVE